MQYSQIVLAVGLEQDGRGGLAQGDVDRGQDGAVHAPERLEMRSGIEHRDDDGKSHLAGLAFGAFNDLLCLM